MRWSDFPIFLAVAQTGSLRRAADRLGIAQPTVARRLRRMEDGMGLRLFDRAQDGHRLTESGSALLPEIRHVEAAALRVEDCCARLSNKGQRTVCIAAGETSAAVLAQGMDRVPVGLTVEVILMDRPDIFSDRVPDITLHHGLPESGKGHVRRVGTIEHAVYGTPDLANGYALPLTDDALSVLPWLGFARAQDHYVTMDWLTQAMRHRPPAARLASTDLMVAAAQKGVGVAALPMFKGDASNGLQRLTRGLDPLSADYWAETPKAVSSQPAIKAAMTWIISCFCSQIS